MPDEPLAELAKGVPSVEGRSASGGEAAPAPEDMLESVEPAETSPAAEVLRSVERLAKEAESAVAEEETEPPPSPSDPTSLTPAAHAAAVAHPKDKLLNDIESVMQEDLKELYKQLPPERRQAFKTRGEHVAQAVRTLALNAHANAKKIFQLLFGWLKMLPGVNRFFLEQEAKIKTDKILLAADEEKRRGTIS